MVYAIDSGSSLMSVTGIIGPTADSPPGVFGMNIFIKNIGNTAAIGMRHTYVFAGAASVDLSIDDFDRMSTIALTQIKDSRKFPITVETQPGDVAYYTASGRRQDYDDNRTGNGFLFLLTEMEYKDKFLPPDKFSVTEACWKISPNGSMVQCEQHK
jgi:hypothetical protein